MSHLKTDSYYSVFSHKHVTANKVISDSKSCLVICIIAVKSSKVSKDKHQHGKTHR